MVNPPDRRDTGNNHEQSGPGGQNGTITKMIVFDWFELIGAIVSDYWFVTVSVEAGVLIVKLIRLGTN